MTTDDRITLESGATIELTEDRGEYHGTCYDLDDARRALRDRPSMERELAELRREVEKARRLGDTTMESLAIERNRLRVALREIAGLPWENGSPSVAAYRMQAIAIAALAKMEGGGK